MEQAVSKPAHHLITASDFRHEIAISKSQSNPQQKFELRIPSISPHLVFVQTLHKAGRHKKEKPLARSSAFLIHSFIESLFLLSLIETKKKAFLSLSTPCFPPFHHASIFNPYRSVIIQSVTQSYPNIFIHLPSISHPFIQLKHVL